MPSTNTISLVTFLFAGGSRRQTDGSGQTGSRSCCVTKATRPARLLGRDEGRLGSLPRAVGAKFAPIPAGRWRLDDGDVGAATTSPPRRLESEKKGRRERRPLRFCSDSAAEKTF